MFHICILTVRRNVCMRSDHTGVRKMRFLVVEIELKLRFEMYFSLCSKIIAAFCLLMSHIEPSNHKRDMDFAASFHSTISLLVVLIIERATLCLIVSHLQQLDVKLFATKSLCRPLVGNSNS